MAMSDKAWTCITACLAGVAVGAAIVSGVALYKSNKNIQNASANLELASSIIEQTERKLRENQALLEQIQRAGALDDLLYFCAGTQRQGPQLYTGEKGMVMFERGADGEFSRVRYINMPLRPEDIPDSGSCVEINLSGQSPKEFH